MSEETSNCRHHWVLSEPAGEAVVGVCKLCGDRREFLAYPESSEQGEPARATAYTLMAPRAIEPARRAGRSSR